MEKKLIIAVALSLMVLLLFQKFSPKPQIEMPSQSAVQTGSSQIAEESRPGEISPARSTKRKPLQKEEVTEIETEKYSMTFSDIGGNLKKLVIKGYNGASSEEILVDAKNTDKQLFSMRSALVADLDVQKFKRTDGDGFIEYSMEEAGHLSIRKRYTYHNSLDYISLNVFIENLSSRDVLFSYQIIGPSVLEKADVIAGRNFLEINASIDEKIWKTKPGKKKEEKTGNIEWVAIKNRYFALILKPFKPAKELIVQPVGKENLITKLNSGNFKIPPRETITNEYCLYAGPLKEDRIAVLGNQNVTSVVDFGFFGGVSKVLLSILKFFHSHGIHNWGVAIICLTILINIVLFPLTYKSFSSMQKMKKLQPHMAKLKELHKDNPHKLNKEMMELYKKYNVNPLGGCLPMILQMPIFIALYQGLMRSVELKGAHFLWIRNLARPDAVPLPFTLPFIGASINILPLLMVVMMVVQQKISQGSAGETTPEQEKQQKMMMMVMPVLFGFLFYRMPSGLVLYWLTNTILMTVEQTFIIKKTNG
ncbi:MAG: membrane protein insertase YidC [Candidatus Omnitrophica bacterium]|nr:membrane protein insertase YidC [Candidatus Omnitrophota bacterium]